MIKKLNYEEQKSRIAELEKSVAELTAVNEHLRIEEERYRVTLVSVAENYFESDLDGKLTYVNDYMTISLKRTREELIGMTNRDIMPPDSARKVYKAFVKLYETGQPINKMDYEVILGDGSHRFHELSASLRMDRDGKPLGFRGVSRDISERKQSEETLRQAEERLRIAMKAGKIGFWESDAVTGNFTYDGMDELMGTDSNTLSEAYDNLFNILFPEDRQQMINALNIALQGGENFVHEFRRPEPDGSFRWFESRGKFVFGLSGNLLKTSGTLIDITDHKQTEQEREKLITELQGALKEVKVLKGILPICASCKKIRDDTGYWNKIESYFRDHSKVEFTHGICPECEKKLYPDLDIANHATGHNDEGTDNKKSTI